LKTLSSIGTAVSNARTGWPHQLRAGTVWINTYRVWNWLMPFGGYKESGYGRENGIQVMEHYTQTKSVWVDLQETPPDWFAS
jgi:aldehyde dehydrogenase (NAD+)